MSHFESKPLFQSEFPAQVFFCLEYMASSLAAQKLVYTRSIACLNVYLLFVQVVLMKYDITDSVLVISSMEGRGS